MSIPLGNNLSAHYDGRHVQVFTVPGAGPKREFFLDRAAAGKLAEVIQQFLGRPPEGKTGANDASGS